MPQPIKVNFLLNCAILLLFVLLARLSGSMCCAVGYIYCIYFLRSSSIFKYLRSSSIVKKLRSSSIFQKIEVVFNLKKNEVVFHISSSWVETMLHTKNQFPWLPRTKYRSSSIWKKLRSSSI